MLVWTARTFGFDSVGFSVAIVWLPMTWVGMTSRRVQVRLPDSYHRLRGVEQSGRLYELVGVRLVKAVLRRGPLAVFNPDLHLPQDRTAERLEHLGRRMRDAEASHAVLFVLTLAIVAIDVVGGWWTAASWTFAVNLLVNGYPVMLQRYNRAHLARRFDLTGV